jgi:hypothetical protein
MDIPIPLRFFEKLNLFQEFRKFEKEDSPEWGNEKSMLSWAANSKRHRDLHTPLNVQMALGNPYITGPIPSDIDDPGQYILNRFGSLVMLGYAQWSDEVTKEGIRFTRAGFLLGEITNEVQRSHKKVAYCINLVLCWALLYAAAFLAISEALKVLLCCISSLAHGWLHCLCR